MAQLTDLLKEIRGIKTSVNKVENIVERRLIGIDEPSKDETEARRDYDRLRKSGRAQYISLGEVLKPLGKVRRPARKTRS